MRPDAWLTDPFGAGLGRWGGAPGGGAPPAWWQPIIDIIGTSGRLAVYTEGVTTGTGASVVAWDDVRGLDFLAQPGASSICPTLIADAVEFDGIDDRLLGDALAGALFNGAHTVILGFDDPEDSMTAVRTFLCAAELGATATTRQVSGNYSDPSSMSVTRQRWYEADSGGSTTAGNISLKSISSIGVGPYNLVFRAGAPGGDVRADLLADPLVQVDTTKTRPSADTPVYAWLTLGARRIGAGPTTAQAWQGRVRYLLVAPASLTDVQLETIRQTLATQGLLS